MPVSVWDVLGLAGGFLAVQSRFLFLPRVYDPIEYFFIASRIESVNAFHRSLRIGLTIPVRMAQELLGYSEVAYYLMPVLAGCGLAVATYFLGRNLFSRAVGLFSAGVVVISPLVLSHSSQLYPDLPSAAVFTGAMALVTGAGQRYKTSSVLDGKSAAMLIAAGLLLGWAYLIREFVVILFPVVLAVVLIYRMPMRVFLWIGATSLMMFGVELLWGWLRYDDAFVRLADLMAKGEPGEAVQERIRQRAAATDSALTKLGTFPRIIGFDFRGLALLALGGLGVIASFFTRDRRLLALTAWSLIYWVLLTGAYIYVDDFGRPILRATLVRYWYPILPGLVIGGFGAIHVLLARRRLLPTRTYVVSGIGLLLIVLGLLAVQPLRTSVTYPGEFREFREWIADHGAGIDTIWTDQRTSWVLAMYTKSPLGEQLWSGRIQPINTARRFRTPDDLDHGLLVYYDQFFRARLSGWRGAVPDGYVDPAPQWVPRFVTSGSDLVVYEYDAETASQHVLTVDEASIIWSAVRGKNSEETSGVFDVEGDGRLVVSVSPHSDGTFMDGIDDIPDRGAIRITLALSVSEGVWVGFHCSFRSDGGSQTRVVRGTTLYHPANGSPTAEYTCDVPDGPGEWEVLPRIILTGEGSVDLGSASVDWFATDD